MRHCGSYFVHVPNEVNDCRLVYTVHGHNLNFDVGLPSVFLPTDLIEKS